MVALPHRLRRFNTTAYVQSWSRSGWFALQAEVTTMLTTDREMELGTMPSPWTQRSAFAPTGALGAISCSRIPAAVSTMVSGSVLDGTDLACRLAPSGP